MRLAALLCLFLIPPLVGCSRSHAPATQLTIRAANSDIGRSEFHLGCEPAGGDLPDPARACAALSATPSLVTSPKRFICGGESWEVTIDGRLNGKAIHRSFSTCWTPQNATLEAFGMTSSSDVLKKHLLPQHHEEVLPETKRVFPPGVLEPADLVTCDIRGHHLESGVPTYTGSTSTGYSGANTLGVILAINRHRDGSVEASCHLDEETAGRIERCTERFLSRSDGGGSATVSSYIQRSYCEPFTRKGWVYYDGALKIDAHLYILSSGSCESATSTPGGQTTTLPCDPRAALLDPLECAVLHYVRRDEVRAYIRKLERSQRLRCDDGTPLDKLGVE